MIPLQSLGVVDAGATHVGETEIMAHALANASAIEMQDAQLIKRSSEFVNEYGRVNDNDEFTTGGTENPNHMMGTFVILWPYGMGGIETKRPTKVPYDVHVRALIQRQGKQFRLHHNFIFQAFGVLQKRQLCRSACLQVQRKSFLTNQLAFQALTPQDLMVASGEEKRKAPFSNPVVKALRGQISGLRAKVMGTDESRIKIRGQIRGMCVMKGPPSLWITINPSDTGDPIAQVLAGESIDLDTFDKSCGPNSEQRATTIGADPYAAAKFFHFIIASLLEELFGIRAYKPLSRVSRRDGVFGKVASYIGTAEAQGRGTLHMHMIIWLVGSLTASKMQQALRTESFRDRVKNYIKANIKADLDGADESKINGMPRVPALSYSRPVDPREEGSDRQAHIFEMQLAKAVQHHKCRKEACLVVKKSRVRCKRCAPFPLSEHDYVNENGEWGPKRTYSYINNWNPPLMQCVWANQNIKLITNGSETRDIAFYISLYVAKRQANSKVGIS